VWAELIGRYLDDDASIVYLECLAELAEGRFKQLTHGRRATYKRGCAGPLCKKAMRDYGRAYQRAKLNPAQIRSSYKQRFDDLLMLVTEAHQAQARRGELTNVQAG
jgi:hypothetical protein